MVSSKEHLLRLDSSCNTVSHTAHGVSDLLCGALLRVGLELVANLVAEGFPS